MTPACLATPLEQVRFVVLDSETTGLNPLKDRLVTIGAVAMENGEIRLDDVFNAMIKVEYNSAAVTVHGVTRQQSLAGLDEPEALDAFLHYLRDSVIVGHHIGHDIATFNAGYQRHWGFSLRNLSLDTMDLTLHLERDGAFQGRDSIADFSLDGLCNLFGVIPHDRHTADGDAFMTAQVFQRLLRLAARCGRTTLGQVCEPFNRGD
ncbi:MAG: 3'-5' exonuclease [Acidobacteria bacterium]|nr:3'-5' exonuclease [Acidobacteriota bacterium]